MAKKNGNEITFSIYLNLGMLISGFGFHINPLYNKIFKCFAIFIACFVGV